MMTGVNVRWWYLPYCIDRVEKNKYVILNRSYKPVGVITDAWVDYEPYAQNIKGLTKDKARKISDKGSDNTDRIYLYNDGCVPTSSKAHWDAYAKRLEVLSNLTVET